VTGCSICGSDLHIYHGHGFSEDIGFCVGHEAVGEVVEVGRASPAESGRQGDDARRRWLRGVPLVPGRGVNSCEFNAGSCYGLSAKLQGVAGRGGARAGGGYERQCWCPTASAMIRR
jgi:threonine dehydrogenase-like Zn-dependent dehydrogenase